MLAAAALRSVFDGLIRHHPVKCIGPILFPFDLDYGLPLRRVHMLRALWTGAYEPLTQRTLARYLSPGGTFLDVGAHIGYFSAVALGMIGPHGAVHAVEPLPYHVTRLERLKALNPWAPLVIHACAASDAVGTRPLYVTGGPQIAGHSLLRGVIVPRELAGTVDVPLRPLTDVLTEYNVRHVDLIKIDVEGHEYEALHGLARWWEATGDRPPILCEVMPGSGLHELGRLLTRCGYHAMTHAGHRIDVTAVTRRTDLLLLAD